MSVFLWEQPGGCGNSRMAVGTATGSHHAALVEIC